MEMTTYKDKIYRFGGGGSISATDAAHAYDPNSDSWSSLSALPNSLHAPDAEVIGDSIYIVGGYASGRYLGGTWIYDVAKDAYTQGPYLNSARSYHNLVRVGDCIYSIGGNNSSNADSVAVSVLRFCSGDDFANVKEETHTVSPLNIFATSNELHISAQINSDKRIHIDIINISGQTIHEADYNFNTDRKVVIGLDQFDVTPGLYVCRVQQGAVQLQTKFVIN